MTQDTLKHFLKSKEADGLSKDLQEPFIDAVNKAVFIREVVEDLKKEKGLEQSAQFKIMNLEAGVFALEALLIDVIEDPKVENRVMAAIVCARESLAELCEVAVFLGEGEVLKRASKLSSSFSVIDRLASQLNLGQ